jgi:cystathionine beta-synthase
MAHTKKYSSLLNVIGNTPLVKINLDSPAQAYVKLEYLNPGGSIKDRSALYMVEQAEKDGLLKPGGTIVEASSGNQGIALAMIGKAKGYKVIITVPERTSDEKKATLRAYGATVHVCPESEDHDDPRSCTHVARRLVKEIPGAFMPNQYYNVLNPQAHYLSTGPEIWKQTEGKVTHFICAMGSCGTISGIGKYLKEQNPNIKVIGVDVNTSTLSSPHGPKPYQSEGIGVDVISDTLNRDVIDKIFAVSDDEIFKKTKDIAHKYGFLVGLSSGAIMQIAEDYARTLSKDDMLVFIFADSGRAYLNKAFKEQ